MSIWVNSQGGKRPSGWHERQRSYQPTLLIIFLMDIMGEKELTMKMGVISVVGCAELSPSGRGRRLKFVFSNGAHWNNKELM